MAFSPIWFLNELELYKKVKPYRLDFDPEDDNFPRTNVVRVQVPRVPIYDLRHTDSDMDFNQCGFKVVEIPQIAESLNYDDPDMVAKQYYPSVEKAVQEFSRESHPGAKVIALDHKVRRRHSTFPVSSGKNYTDPQPVMVAHVDWTPDSIRKKLLLVAGKQTTDSILSRNYQFCHAWRPLFGPLRDYPLALCDYSSVDPDTDYEPADDVHENHGVDENYMVYHRPGHKWYYLRDQKATEALLFRQYDSTVGLRSGVPHCAIPNPVPTSQVLPRESIEVELVVYWP